MVGIRAKRFLRRNPELTSFTASDLVADRDRLTEDEISERAVSMTKGLAQLVELGTVAIVGGSDSDELAYALTELGTSGMGDDEVAAVLR